MGSAAGRVHTGATERAPNRQWRATRAGSRDQAIWRLAALVLQAQSGKSEAARVCLLRYLYGGGCTGTAQMINRNDMFIGQDMFDPRTPARNGSWQEFSDQTRPSCTTCALQHFTFTQHSKIFMLFFT